MNIAIVGTGYVGLVSGTCFSEMGINVTCVDVDEKKIESLKQGIVPIYEPGLETLVHKNARSGRLHFTTRLEDVLDEVDIVFTAVGTPPDEDGSADLKYVLAVARTIGQHLNHYVVVVTKSTVPVGTAQKIKKTIQDELDRRGVQVEFDVASNPEFLKEGAAVKDFMSPDRVVVGVESERARHLMARLYKPFMLVNDRMIFTDIPSAEMIKYAANSMLATRISFMNDIANLCERVGANVNMVRKGIGADTRIGNKFLYPGCGYGGSCFPKTIALWGLAFKPETDDMREAPALVLIERLLDAGAFVKVYDPVAMDECRRRLGDKVTYCHNMYEAASDAHALLLVTEWREFRVPNLKVLTKVMRQRIVLDGRNILDANELQQAGFTYLCIGR